MFFVACLPRYELPGHCDSAGKSLLQGKRAAQKGAFPSRFRAHSAQVRAHLQAIFGKKAIKLSAGQIPLLMHQPIEQVECFALMLKWRGLPAPFEERWVSL
ncbi:MAG: hypothetical protein PUI29_11455 [Aeromonadales bacterium]|nr:hypothetical protein [Aeromonadales bacterium]MDY2890858.1 hypothetical protein [Succinivibrio sp.]